jgi:hypothetical protein
MAALVTVFPVPGGPWIKNKGVVKALLMPNVWK